MKASEHINNSSLFFNIQKSDRMKTNKPILLAEDNPLDIELTLEVLQEFNFANDIIVLNDGIEVLDFLRYEGNYKNREKIMPSLLLLDIKMPKMDGIQVLEILRKDKAFNKLPIVMLTSSREEKDLNKIYEIGINAYVVKPLNFIEFKEAVKNIRNFWTLLNELP